MLPRKCGPASFQLRRVPSPCSVHSPLRVATSSVVVLGARPAVAPFFFAVAMTVLPFARSRLRYRDSEYAASVACADTRLRCGVEISMERGHSLDPARNSKRGARMAIKVGDRLPEGTLSEYIEVEGNGCTVGPNEFKVGDLTRGRKVVIFGLPGAFTPTCSAKHVPS